MALDVISLNFSYGEKSDLRDISLHLGGGQVLGIVGPNGSGKTTLIRCITRILEPSSGEVILDGEDLSGLTRTEIAKRIGFVPQTAYIDQMPPSVYEVVLMGRLPYIAWNYTERDRKIAWEAMRDMNVAEYASRPFNKLSSGQAQRVLVARAIAQGARLIMLDEPTSNLDIRYQIDVLETIRSTVKGRGFMACLIIHDLDLAMRFCDEILMIDDGEVVDFGPSMDVLTPENIAKVFGIECVVNTDYGRPRILILNRCANVEKWSRLRNSNPRPADYKSAALPGYAKAAWLVGRSGQTRTRL